MKTAFCPFAWASAWWPSGGAVAYLLAGVVNWRDYQQKVDWGVVWLYAGAIIFGRTLDSTGAAYWLARSVTDALAPLGLNSGLPLMAVTNGLTGVVTNLMADGPCRRSHRTGCVEYCLSGPSGYHLSALYGDVDGHGRILCLLLDHWNAAQCHHLFQRLCHRQGFFTNGA